MLNAPTATESTPSRDEQRLIDAVSSASDEVRSAILRNLILAHPDALEDGGRVAIDVPPSLQWTPAITVRSLAEWLAPTTPQAFTPKETDG